MCLVVLALGLHPRCPFILGANRDENHQRPTASARRWADMPDVIGGRDLDKGGTWLAFSRHGAFAIVTNFRDPARRSAGGLSRGHLVREFVSDPRLTAETYLADRLAAGSRYDGFNMMAGDAGGVWFGSNRGAGPRRLGPGLYGLSNHLLDTPWPKVLRVKQAAGYAIARDDERLVTALFDALGDREPAPDGELPSTGVPLASERLLSAPFIVSPEYGTRCSTVATVDLAGRLALEERSFDADGEHVGTNIIRWRLERTIGLSDPASAA